LALAGRGGQNYACNHGQSDPLIRENEMYRAFAIVLLYCALGTGIAAGQQAAPTSPRQGSAQQPATPAGKQSAPTAPQEKLSDAERIMRLQRTVEEDEQRLGELNAKLNDPDGEYVKAKTDFETLDKELEAKRKELRQLNEQGQADRAAAVQKDLADLEKRWQLAKDRFDLAIQERKTRQEQKVTLEEKIKRDREALNRLLSPPATQPATSGPAPTTTPAQVPGEAPSDQTTPASPATATPSGAPAATTADGTQAPAAKPAGPAKPPSKELLKAEEEALARETEAQTAEEEVRDIEQRIADARAVLESVRKELQTARAQADNADERRRVLDEQIKKRSSEGAPQAELQELWRKKDEARQQYRNAKAGVAQLAEQVDKSQENLDGLQAEHIQTLREAEEKRKAADKARGKVEEIKNPFTPRNLLQWAVDHGPRILGILLGMFVLLWLARVAEKRIVKILVGPATGHEAAERENRARTLASVFHNAANLVIIIGGIFMILDEVGVPIAPLLGGAAVIGLAVAFGAQNLVRDYFSGFMILLENQYGINDVIKVGDVGGLVERVTLRVTVLRGLDGTAHFIPNGQIDKVSNMTHGWSRALFEIGVAYKEDVDQVMQVLVKLGKELRADPTFRQLILDDPEMLGVDSFDDSAVVIKFFIKTRPLKQWTVKRAMLRRIKKKFDELGIEIPFPHRTVFVHHESGEAPVPQLPSDSTPVE
jgi:small conductance mechanosensitive channel